MSRTMKFRALDRAGLWLATAVAAALTALSAQAAPATDNHVQQGAAATFADASTVGVAATPASGRAQAAVTTAPSVAIDVVAESETFLPTVGRAEAARTSM